MGSLFTPYHAAACMACLPVGCALFASEKPEYRILLGEMPVAAIADALKAAKKGPTEKVLASMTIGQYQAWKESRESRGGTGNG